MKTVVGSLLGVDRHLHYTGEAAPEPLGNCHGDLCVRFLLGLPHVKEPEAVAPTLVLEGRRGARLELCRRKPGRTYHLTVRDGEQGAPIDELRAVYRVRLFVEHHGEETEHTEEIRLPPEVRQQIRDREEMLDAERSQRLKREAPRRVFRKRGSLLGLFKGYALVVDRKANAVFEERRGKDHELLDLDQVHRADVDMDEGEAGCRVVVELKDGTEDHPVGKVRWSREDAVAIAEAVNDALGLPESLRKLLRYRRAAEASGGARG